MQGEVREKILTGSHLNQWVLYMLLPPLGEAALGAGRGWGKERGCSEQPS